MFKRKTIDMRDLDKALKRIRILTNQQRSDVMQHFEKSKYAGLDEYQLKNAIRQMKADYGGSLNRFVASQVERTLSELALPKKEDEEQKPKRKPPRF
jgi:uncharacterized membrane-anchored protein YhcB (DUF1043 family)